MSEYAELRCKTNYSFLRGASHPAELVTRAHELGLKALAISDANGVYGIPKAYRASKECPGLKLITGAELTIAGKPPLTLLAQDRQGYGLLCRMITASHADKPKGEASLTWEEFLKLMQRPGNQSLIAIAESGSEYGQLKELFSDRVFLPLSRMLDGWDAKRTEKTLETSRLYDIKIIATNDVHYHSAERRTLQDVLSSIREGVGIQDAGRKLFSNAERYLKSTAQMKLLFKDLPTALTNTLSVADRCTFSPGELRYRYPSEWIPSGETAQSYLRTLVYKGAEWRYSGAIPEDVKTQLEHELALVDQLGFADYFLTIWEIVDYAKEKKILCQGRGSAANSAVCFCLGITAVDPVRMNLLFERFISTERGEPPDIDVDFEHERREEVIQHIYEKYGRDRAAMVAAVITYRSKLSIREVSKVLPPQAPEGLAEQLAETIYGFPRHLSIHSGGFTLSADPLIETVPVEPARMENRTIVQWDKDDLDAIGLLKVDVLSLGMLTAIRKACDLVGNGLTLATMPAEDPKTYAMMQRADTVGVFQIESRAQMNMLGRLQPKTFYDLVIQVAIVRPGPIVGKMVHPYLKCRRGETKPNIPHPALEPILRKTLGVPLFQEQVMKMAIVLANFTPGEADELRRAIGAWRSNGSIEKMGKKLMQGLLKSGLSKTYVELIFAQIKGFAEYGFPESHAASFALLAYASSYLKCHHPAEFTCALVNSQPMGFYSNHTLIDDAKRHRVRVLPIHPKYSNWDCEIENGAIRLGFRVVKGMSEQEAMKIVAERTKEPFQNLADFLSRVELRANVLHCLAMGDAFECFGLDQRHSLWEILSHDSQLNLFSGLQTQEQNDLFQPLDSYNSIQSEYASYRLSVKGHPMQPLREKINGLPKITAAQAKGAPNGRTLSIAGLIIVRQRPPTAAGTVFATLEDETGFVDLVLRKEIHARYEELFTTQVFLIARGTIQRDGFSVSLIVDKLKSVWDIQNGIERRADKGTSFPSTCRNFK